MTTITIGLSARLAEADSDELVELLTHPSVEQAQQLRDHLGPETYQRMRSLALHKAIRQRETDEPSRGNVMFIPPMLHNELSVVESGGRTPVWLSARSVAAGHLHHLRLNATGLAEANPDKQVVVSGLMVRYCGEFLLSLAQHRKVCAFTYDWRKSLKLAATLLQARIEACFPSQEAVDIVAVGEGGVVARLYLALYGESRRRRGGRLVTIGGPQRGAPIYLQALVGHLDIVQWLDMLDTHYKREEYLGLLHTFPSLYQLLPFASDGNEALLDKGTYGNLTTIQKEHLDSAAEVQALIRAAFDPARQVAVVGYGRSSIAAVDITEFKQVMAQMRPDEQPSAAKMSHLYRFANGDGHVAICCSKVASDSGEMVPTLFVDVSAGPLVGVPALLSSLEDLLEAGKLDAATLQDLASKHGLKTSEVELGQLPEELHSKGGEEQELKRIEQLTRRLKRSIQQMDTSEDSEQERVMEAVLMRQLGAVALPAEGRRVVVPFDPPEVAIEAIFGDISQIDGLDIWPKEDRVDAIAAGHYLGGTAVGGLAALDKAIALHQAAEQAGTHAGTSPGPTLMLEDLLERGTIRGELSNLFLLPDPRPAGVAVQRVIVVAGMGVPGRFGAPELTILARELCWTLGRIGKKHLATVLTGVGLNNLTTSEAAEAWVRGIKLAITGASDAERLRQITFVSNNPQCLIELDQRLQELARDLGNRKRMTIKHTPLDQIEWEKVRDEAEKQIERQIIQRMGSALAKGWAPGAQRKTEASERKKGDAGEELRDYAREPAPIRIAVEFEGENYRFGAITQEAAVADRQITLDSRIIAQANDRLASFTDLEEQQRQGEFLAGFLLPDDFYVNLSGGSPIVLTLDSDTARIHWEMLCLTEQQILGRDTTGDKGGDSAPPNAPEEGLFLGMACGLTRQLRTPFARPPEPIPQQKRLLRVLVVADPAADARLPGAQEEGDAVADLLELYNLLTPTYNRIEVVRLIGPAEATRVDVLQHLMTRSYDVLHFAGHCSYEADRPRATGWLFTNGERLTANEIQRLDRVPSLVVSNACESGITPERAGKRSAALAPTFAETFFARGVANFICTAWPVGDREARDFALSLYADLLGLDFKEQTGERTLRTDSRLYCAGAAKPFHVAMRNARRVIAGQAYDGHSWGAYQHYGNPYGRLFARTASDRQD